jgi:DNA-binding MarR family transcriptional regulator
MASVEDAVLDGRIVAASLVWGAELERAGDRAARGLTPGLNYRDLLLASELYRLGGHALPSELIGPVYTTAPGVSGSLRRLERAGVVTRGVGADARTRPVRLAPEASRIRAETFDAWSAFHDELLGNLDEAERAELYRLLLKGSGQWKDVWPTELTTQAGRDDATAATSPVGGEG